jgi:hypothetical protein
MRNENRLLTVEANAITTPIRPNPAGPSRRVAITPCRTLSPSARVLLLNNDPLERRIFRKRGSFLNLESKDIGGIVHKNKNRRDAENAEKKLRALCVSAVTINSRDYGVNTSFAHSRSSLYHLMRLPSPSRKLTCGFHPSISRALDTSA